MTHMVFMKFEDGFFDESVFKKISRAYTSLAAALPQEILSVSLSRNCVKRDTNMDILIELRLKEEDSLQRYLRHPIHLEIGEVMNPHVVSRASFDRKD